MCLLSITHSAVESFFFSFLTLGMGTVSERCYHYFCNFIDLNFCDSFLSGRYLCSSCYPEEAHSFVLLSLFNTFYLIGWLSVLFSQKRFPNLSVCNASVSCYCCCFFLSTNFSSRALFRHLLCFSLPLQIFKILSAFLKNKKLNSMRLTLKKSQENRLFFPALFGIISFAVTMKATVNYHYSFHVLWQESTNSDECFESFLFCCYTAVY